ncbi:MAG: hypothetical protein M0Z42_14660 [Actinomycetota bacterium]|nr:hypothetical protein [Actinomycetota bacterium]
MSPWVTTTASVRVQVFERGGHPLGHLARRFTSADRRIRTGPGTGQLCVGLPVSQPFEPSEVLFTPAPIEVDRGGQGIGDDPCGLDRPDQVAGDHGADRLSVQLGVGADRFRRGGRLPPPEVGQLRVGDLPLGPAQDVPLGLAVADQVDHRCGMSWRRR